MDDDINIRILRVTEDLRAIQQELNWSVVDAPDTQKVEAIDLQALQALKSALDQMRHFLWFYIQVITNESEFGEKLRQVLRQRTSGEQISESEASFLERLNFAADAALLRCLADSKNRKPN